MLHMFNINQFALIPFVIVSESKIKPCNTFQISVETSLLNWPKQNLLTESTKQRVYLPSIISL